MKIRTVLATLPVFLGALLLSAPAAHATDHNGSCENNELCVYKDQNFGAGILDFSAGHNYPRYSDFDFLNCRSRCGAHDAVSSLQVNGTRDVRLFRDLNCASNSHHLTQAGPGFRQNLALDRWDDGAGGVNDQIDSHCWL